MNTGKVRRRLVENRVREFRDACEFVIDHPLLRWSPPVDDAATALVKAVRKARDRQRVWSGQKQK
jgi:hypothetical protein